MKAKKWVILFVSLMVMCLLVITSLNYFVDPCGYFRAQGGTCYSLNDDYYLREIKAEHIRTCGKNYDAFLIGGSKAGSIKVDSLSKLDGYKYYNAWVLSGTFEDYYYYTKYILKTNKPKKIVWQLSTTELRDLNREHLGSNYTIPAQVMGQSKLLEAISFLFKNPSLSVDELKLDKSSITPSLPTGERNINKYYGYQAAHKNNYYERYIKSSAEENIKHLLNGGAGKRTQNVNDGIELIRRAKSACEEAGVKFQLYVAPTFIGEQLHYEGDGYYYFLKRLLAIQSEVWCFNDINEYTCNPYNFYNNGHFYYEIGDIVMETIAQDKQKYPGFGTKVTLNNLGTYIDQRKENYKKLRDYYLKNKKLPIGKYQDSSDLVRIEHTK